ncbi:MAG: hypothetical protein Q4D87_08480 [Actinomycetaceae bacterium]|nr:hypothetical protein [Actinomycetaceae bacterium]
MAKGNIALLAMFTVMYLVPVVLVSETRVAVIAGALFVGLFGVGLTLIRVLPLPARRNVTKLQGSFIALTSIAELIAVLTGLGIGFITDAWSPFGLLLVGSVAMHFLSLTIAYRRVADYFALTLVVVSFVLLVVQPITPLWDLWAIAGSIVAASTALYIVELSRFLRRL